MRKPCIFPAPTTIKLPHASGHSCGYRQGHVTKTKTQRFEIFVDFKITNVLFLLDSWHHLYIFSYYHSFNGISSLANYMVNLLWGWKPRFAVALVVRGLLIVTSHTNCDVTSCPVVMRCYANTMGTNRGTRRRKRKFPLLFVKLWSWQNRNWPLIRSALEWLVLQSGTAVTDCSTNHSSADRIVVNSYS